MTELDAVVRKHCVNAIRHGINDSIQERRGALPVGRLRQAYDGKLRGSAWENLSNIKIKEPNR